MEMYSVSVRALLHCFGLTATPGGGRGLTDFRVPAAVRTVTFLLSRGGATGRGGAADCEDCPLLPT